jgi:hypothetical protein
MAALTFVHADDQWSAFPAHLRGRIIQVVNSGILLAGSFDTGDRDGAANPIVLRGTFFLRGSSPSQFEGDKIDLMAIPDGAYDYTNTQGAAAHIRAFKRTE